ncbi:MAG: hypothetical protein ACREMX_16435 [Gemmatimonadales bacterium]
MRREVLVLVGSVLAVDAIFLLVYFATPLRAASGSMKLGYTVAWTLATLAVVLRGLARIRAARVRRES